VNFFASAIIAGRAFKSDTPFSLDDVGVWYDYSCIPQKNSEGIRNVDDEHKFRESLDFLANFIASENVHVVALRYPPEYEDSASVDHRHYEQRGWCLAESACCEGRCVEYWPLEEELESNVRDEILFRRVPILHRNKSVFDASSDLSSIAQWFDVIPGRRTSIGYKATDYVALDTGSSIDMMGAEAVYLLRDREQPFKTLSELVVYLMGTYNFEVDAGKVAFVGMLILYWTCYDLDEARMLFLKGFGREVRNQSTNLERVATSKGGESLAWKLCNSHGIL